MMLVDDAFEFISEAESTCINVVFCYTAESLPSQLRDLEEPSEDSELEDGDGWMGDRGTGGQRIRGWGLKDGESKDVVSDGEVKVDFIDSKKGVKTSSKRRCVLKWMRCRF